MVRPDGRVVKRQDRTSKNILAGGILLLTKGLVRFCLFVLLRFFFLHFRGNFEDLNVYFSILRKLYRLVVVVVVADGRESS